MAFSDQSKGPSLHTDSFYIFMCTKKFSSLQDKEPQKLLQRQRTFSGCLETRFFAYSIHSTLEIAKKSILHCVAALLPPVPGKHKCEMRKSFWENRTIIRFFSNSHEKDIKFRSLNHYSWQIASQ